MSKIIEPNKIKDSFDIRHKFSLKEFQSIDLKNKDIKKILIIKWGGMGDIILATGIMHDIYKSFPKSKIHLNTLPQWKHLFKNDPRFEKIWGTNKAQEIGSLRHFYQWLKTIKYENYDLIIDLQTNDRTRIYLSILRMINLAPTYLVGNHPVFPYSIYPKKNINLIHPFQLLQRTINTIGLKSTTIYPRLFITKEEEKLALSILQKNNLEKDRYVVFICGSNRNGKQKRWGAQNFVKLAKIIRSELNLEIILIGGLDDIDECNLIVSIDKKIINLCNKTELKTLPYIFKNAKLIVGNDTGSSHLVATTKTPMIEMFGPTDPKKSKPLRTNIVAIRAPNLSMKNISVDYVFKKLKEIL
jgi:heptosyltransferase-2